MLAFHPSSHATMPRKLFVTTALPYANGPFHIGHIMEYIQADIWVRFQRMQGNEVHFVCADDAHGAPIMIAAEKAGITPQEFVARDRRRPHSSTSTASTSPSTTGTRTDSPENTRAVAGASTARCKAAGLIDTQADRAVLRPGQGHVPAGPLHQGRVPELRRQGPVRRHLRSLRRGLRADRAEEPVLGAHRRDAGAEDVRALLLQAVRPALRRLPARLD